jgi:prepilin-type processing-associated H-X9-DG protein
MPRCRIFFTMNLAVPLAWVGLEQAVAETLEVVSTGEAKLLVLPDPGWPPPGNCTPDTPPAGQSDRWIFFPHRGKCNGLFLDGHVESFSGRLPASAIRPP